MKCREFYIIEQILSGGKRGERDPAGYKHTTIGAAHWWGKERLKI